ncbi:hypothetical protein AMTR_s00235p00019100 [Amborella trichopoda]|uniref:Uncharacterized protein n=1 Tax=Amborella trichopoda TaxID=13333 RepID=W1NXF9_AMBTC|nr:hypothetical protein AMTR_s00235p00019100 [Amborella trichopoda]
MRSERRRRRPDMVLAKKKWANHGGERKQGIEERERRKGLETERKFSKLTGVTCRTEKVGICLWICKGGKLMGVRCRTEKVGICLWIVKVGWGVEKRAAVREN